MVESLPRHVGIIMDGNGRWATTRNLPRTHGHRAGVTAAEHVVVEAIRLGVEALSLYAFSTENWRRAKQEVAFLMRLVARNLRDQYDFYRKNRVKVLHSGDLARLPVEVRNEIATVTYETRNNDAITVNLAINYGGRDEIVRATRHLVKDGVDPAAIDESTITRRLDLPQLPDLDLIIRTGGERRLSNFMLWNSAYAELYFSDVPWPEWNGAHFRDAVKDFTARKRNFGGTS